MDAQNLPPIDAGALAQAGLGLGGVTAHWWIPSVAAVHHFAGELTFYGGALLVVAGVAREACRAWRWWRS